MLGTGCPYSISLPLRLGLLPGPGSAPLGLAGGTMGALTIYRWVHAQAGLEEGIFSFTNDRTSIITYLSSLFPSFNTISLASLGAPGDG